MRNVTEDGLEAEPLALTEISTIRYVSSARTISRGDPSCSRRSNGPCAKQRTRRNRKAFTQRSLRSYAKEIDRFIFYIIVPIVTPCRFFSLPFLFLSFLFHSTSTSRPRAYSYRATMKT